MSCGETEEARALALEVKHFKPVDPHTLQALTSVFKSLAMDREIAEMYENAFNAIPSEEFANHWFMALVRMGDAKSFQLASLDLYFRILEEDGKYGDALAILEGPFGNLIRVETERSRALLAISRKMENWQRSLEIATKIVTANSDDWIAYEAISEALCNIGDGDDSISSSWKTIDALQELTLAEKRPRRGPFLAELLFVSKGLSRSEPKSLSELIIDYLNKFGTALSCFDDIRPYLHAVDESERESLSQSLQSMAPVTATELPELNQIDVIRMDINIRKAIRFFAPLVAASESSSDIIKALIQRYHLSSPLGEKMDERERQPGDDYIVLAVEYLLDSFYESRDHAILYQAICILEYGVSKSKFNYQFKFMLIRIYLEIGVFERPLDLADSMEIKNIQLDTLSYLYLDNLEVYGTFANAVRLFMGNTSIYKRNKIETTDAIIRAFQYATFSKASSLLAFQIPEFLKFRDRVDKSVQREHFHLQTQRVENLVRGGQSIEEMHAYYSKNPYRMIYKEETPSTFSDNRDMGILVQYACYTESIASKILGKQFPETNALWRKIYDLQTILVSRMCVQESDPSETIDLENQLEAALEICETPSTIISARILCAVSRLARNRHNDASELVPGWQAVVEQYSAAVDIVLAATDPGLSRRLAEEITCVMESATFILLGLFISGIDTTHLLKKQKNKHRAHTDKPEHALTNIFTEIASSTKRVETALQQRLIDATTAHTDLVTQAIDANKLLGIDCSRQVSCLACQYELSPTSIS
eukprot:jgi/Hompol1/5462/HPOL_004454-RA